MGKGNFAAFGPLIQMAYVAYDFDPLIRYWTEIIGAGPFFYVDSLRFDSSIFRGQPQDIVIDVAIGYWGELQVEFIRPRTDAPSVFSEWLRAGRTGLHHFAIKVSNIEEARRNVFGMGLSITQESTAAAFLSEPFFYVDTGSYFIELLSPNDALRSFWKMMHQAHLDWDGSDPLRTVPKE